MTSEEDLLKSLLEKIYLLVCGPDTINNLAPVGGSYVSFCLPGIPLGKDDLDFSFVELNKSEIAADFASLVNTVPPPRGQWVPSDRKVDAYYKRVLSETIRPVVTLNNNEKKRLASAQEMLTRMVDAVDLTTGATKKVPADTPLYEAYQERMGDYLAALTTYRSLQADYLGRPNDPAAQSEWFTKAGILRQKVQQKYDRWLAGGKTQIEEAIATIAELGRGTGERWQRMKEVVRLAEQTTPEGTPYLFTKFFPSKFWDEAHATSWTKFSMGREEVHTVNETSSTSFGGGGGFNLGLWSVGGSASYAEQKSRFKSDGLISKVEVELVRIPIRRSWWDATIFWDRGWKFDPQISSLVLSDGKIPPNGELPAYPTAMIVAKNLKLGIDMTSEENTHVATQFSASASVGWGPFSVRGNYSRNTDRKTHDFTRTAAGIECAGMQVIGFVCEMLPKSPDPDPNLNWQA